MAGFRMEGTEELARQLMDMASLDALAPKMIEDALPILEGRLKEAVRQEANKGYATGELAASIKKGKAKKNQYGHFGMVCPTGKDRKGVRNMEKLAYLNYGTPKQEARPVVARATAQAAQAVAEQMQETFRQGVESAWR